MCYINLRFTYLLTYLLVYHFYWCRTAKPITLNEWHLAHLWRHGRKGILQLDGKPTVNGTSRGAFTQLTLTLDLFLGGHRNFDEVARNADVSKSFRGCIQKVVLSFFPLACRLTINYVSTSLVTHAEGCAFKDQHLRSKQVIYSD